MERNTVDLWPISLDLPEAVWSPWLRLLDRTELDRIGRCEPATGRRFAVARAVTRMILGRYLGVAPRDVPLRYLENGKPVVSGLQHNLSHCADRALLAVTADRPVGVDLEAGHRLGDPLRLATRFFTPAEAAAVAGADPRYQRQLYLRLWTRKESCVKAAGARLSDGLRLPVLPSVLPSVQPPVQPPVLPDRSPPTAAPTSDTEATLTGEANLTGEIAPTGGFVVRSPAGRTEPGRTLTETGLTETGSPGTGLTGCWWVSDLPVAAPFVAAVAVAGPVPCRLRLHSVDQPWSDART